MLACHLCLPVSVSSDRPSAVIASDLGMTRVTEEDFLCSVLDTVDTVVLESAKLLELSAGVMFTTTFV